MRIMETTVYKYAELSDRAKERARQWWREASAGDSEHAESVTSDFLEALKALGFDTRDTYISWSGFWSQGDGAAFSGSWYASGFAPGKLLANRPTSWDATEHREAGTSKENIELHRVAAELLACKKDGLTSGSISANGRGFRMRLEHAYITNPETDDSDDAPEELGERFIEAARDLAHAFYTGLEAEYEYQNSDEVVVENIEANEYEFTAEGRHV